MSRVTQSVRFNGVPLSTIEDFNVIRTNPAVPPARKLTSASISNSSNVAISSALYEPKKIIVEGVLVRTGGKAAFETGLRQLQGLLQARNKLLTFDVAGAENEYTATLANLAVSDHAGGYANISLEFLCTDPHGYTTAWTTIASSSGLTSGLVSSAYTWLGNVAQTPYISIDINSVTLSGSTGVITISSPSTDLNIEYAYAANNLLIVNCREKNVTIDGTTVDFTGTFPEWSGTSAVTYSDNFSARNFDYLVKYQIRNI